jgi:hypothetical protein
MKAFTCTKFKGHWPVGVSAIIIAPTAFMAVELLEEELTLAGIPQEVKISKLEEISLEESKAIILRDGDY